MVGEISSDQISEFVLTMEDHSPSSDGGKSYIHVVFKSLWQNCLRSSVDINENILKTEGDFLSTVNNGYMLLSQPYSIVTIDILLTLDCDFF